MSRSNIDLVRTLHYIWSSGDGDLIPDVYAPDFVGYWPPSAVVPVRRGHDGVLFGMTALREAFPDWTEAVIDIFGSGDRVASRTVAGGTHLAAFGGLEPTGRRVEIQESSTFRIENGRVIEHRCLFDEMTRLTNLDVPRSYLARMLGR